MSSIRPPQKLNKKNTKQFESYHRLICYSRQFKQNSYILKKYTRKPERSDLQNVNTRPYSELYCMTSEEILPKIALIAIMTPGITT